MLGCAAKFRRDDSYRLNLGQPNSLVAVTAHAPHLPCLTRLPLFCTYRGNGLKPAGGLNDLIAIGVTAYLEKRAHIQGKLKPAPSRTKTTTEIRVKQCR